MKGKTIKANIKRFLKRVVWLNCCVLFGQQLTAQSFNDFAIPAELIKANRVRSIKQEYTSGYPFFNLRKHIYTYDDSGRLEQVVYLIKDTPRVYTFYKYDTTQKVLLKVLCKAAEPGSVGYLVDGFLNKVDETVGECHYDSNTQLLASITYSSDSGLYKVDSFFHNPRVEVYRIINKKGEILRIDKHSFDSFGNIKSIERITNYTKGQEIFLSTYKSKYDKHNCIKESLLDNGSEKTKIKYEYYDNGLLRSKTFSKYSESFVLSYQLY